MVDIAPPLERFGSLPPHKIELALMALGHHGRRSWRQDLLALLVARGYLTLLASNNNLVLTRAGAATM